MSDPTEIVKALAWPVVVLISLWKFAAPMAKLIVHLGHRVATAKEVSLGPKGLQLKGEVASNTARLDALEVQVKSAVTPSLRLGDQPGTAVSVIPTELLELAKAYRAVAIPDYARRVRRKDELAAQIADEAVKRRVPRKLLAESKNEGLYVGLATVIISDPAASDVALWLEAAPHVTLKHVAYRMVVALSKLQTQDLVRPAQRVAIDASLERFRGIADDPLLRVIERAEYLLAQAA